MARGRAGVSRQRSTTTPCGGAAGVSLLPSAEPSPGATLVPDAAYGVTLSRISGHERRADATVRALVEPDDNAPMPRSDAAVRALARPRAR
jgi:hypothetical protein